MFYSNRNRLLKERAITAAVLMYCSPERGVHPSGRAIYCTQTFGGVGQAARLLPERFIHPLPRAAKCREVRYEQKANNSTLLYPQSVAEAAEDFYREYCRSVSALISCAAIRASVPTAMICSYCSTVFPLRAFGSQGQQRSGALALKLSQPQYVKNELGEFPSCFWMMS